MFKEPLVTPEQVGRYFERRRKGIETEMQDIWHNCRLYVRAKSGQLLYPVVVKRKTEKYGYSLELRLPVGLSDVHFRARLHSLAWALGGDIEMEPRRGRLFMRVLTGEVNDFYPYREVEIGEMNMPVPVGYARDGLTIIDLARAPHLLVGGVPGSGKSNWLHQAICTLLSAGVKVYIVDLKRLEFACYKKHAHCIFREQDCRGVIEHLTGEMERRMNLLEASGVVKMQDYPDSLPYIALVIDEVAELQDEQAWHKLNRLVRLSRALGISVIMATQRPSVKVIDGDTRGLLTARLAFRVPDETNSRIIIDGPQAAYLPSTPGRAIYRNGNSIKDIQAMYLPAPEGVKKILAEVPEIDQPTPEPAGGDDVLIKP